jgi:hypothetical protein
VKSARIYFGWFSLPVCTDTSNSLKFPCILIIKESQCNLDNYFQLDSNMVEDLVGCHRRYLMGIGQNPGNRHIYHWN